MEPPRVEPHVPRSISKGGTTHHSRMDGLLVESRISKRYDIPDRDDGSVRRFKYLDEVNPLRERDNGPD